MYENAFCFTHGWWGETVEKIQRTDLGEHSIQCEIDVS